METRHPLPDNDQALAAIARIGLSEWLEDSPKVRPFFISKNGKLHHKRCNDELDSQDKLAKRRSVVGKKGAEARHNKNKDIDALGMPEATDELAEDVGEASLEQAVGMPEATARLGAGLLQDRTRQDKTVVRESTATTDSTSQTPRLRKRDAPFFSLRTVRLNQADYERWKKTYFAIPDFNAELMRIDDSLTTEAERKGWFVSTSAKLNFAHKANLAQAATAAAGPGHNNGPPPRKLSVAEMVAKRREWGLQLASSAEVRQRVYAEGLAEAWTFGDG